MKRFFLFCFLLSFTLSEVIRISHPVNKSKVSIASDDYLLNFSINGQTIFLNEKIFETGALLKSLMSISMREMLFQSKE